MIKEWLRCASIRAVKTMAQTAVGVIGASFVLSEVDWWVVLSAAILAGVCSMLTSIAGIPEADGGASPIETYKEETRSMDIPKGSITTEEAEQLKLNIFPK